MEVQSHGLEEQVAVTDGHLRIARAIGAPLCGTNDSHYLEAGPRARPRGAALHPDRHDHERPEPVELLDATSSTSSRPTRCARSSRTCPRPTATRWRWPSAATSTSTSASSTCRKYQVPDGLHAGLLSRASWPSRASRARYGSSPADAVVERLRYELGVISKMGFSGYFLVVWDFIALRAPRRASRWGRAAAPPPARSSPTASASPTSTRSATGSSSSASSTPSGSRCRTWTSTSRTTGATRSSATWSSATGADRVAHIITFGTHGGQGGHPRRGPRARLLLRRGRPHRQAGARLPAQHHARRGAREVAAARRAGQARPAGGGAVGGGPRARGLHPARLGARLRGGHLGRAPDGAGAALQGPQAARAHHRLRDGADREARPAQDGLPRAADAHRDRGRGCAWSRSRAGSSSTATRLPLDDAKTYQLLTEARTFGVFQLESAGMRDALKRLKPQRIEDIIAMVALYRPGPMDLIPDFVNRKHGRAAITYEHPADGAASPGDLRDHGLPGAGHAARRRPGRLHARRGRHAPQGDGEEGPRADGHSSARSSSRAARPTRSTPRRPSASGTSSRSSRATASTSA